MFKGKKYVTAGIEAEISKELQLFLWRLISDMKVEKVDYLQVFKISPVENGLNILHTQEVPPYRNEHFYKTEESVTAKIFVIDDGPHATMLFSHEY